MTSYGYASATGQLATLTAPGGVGLAYTYDGFLPLAETWSGPVAGTIARAYNNDFQVRSLSVNGTPIDFAYDADLLLTRAGALTINRRADNGLISGTTLGLSTTAQTYNPFGELATFEARHDASVLYSASYQRDKLGRIVSKTESVQGTTTVREYAYDPAGRLSEVSVNGGAPTRYVYDANGNRTDIVRAAPLPTLGAAYDAQDRLTSFSGASYSYSANGELLSMTAGTETTRYDYDVLGNLRRVELPNLSTIKYVIDGRNRRIGKQVDGVLVQGFLYHNQLKPVAELDGAGNLVARFVYGSRSNVPDYMIKGGVTYRIISDHLGSPRLVVNAATGAVAQRMDYDEWGNVGFESNPGFQPFGFAGGIYDRDTKLTRFGARDYDAIAGRWTAKDPISFAGGDGNLYRPVSGDLVNLIDPSGLVTEPGTQSSSDTTSGVQSSTGTANSQGADWARAAKKGVASFTKYLSWEALKMLIRPKGEVAGAICDVAEGKAKDWINSDKDLKEKLGDLDPSNFKPDEIAGPRLKNRLKDLENIDQ